MLIDANIFLELFLNQEKAENCRIFLNKTFSGEEKAIVSTFTIDSIIITLETKKVSYEKISLMIAKIMQSEGIAIYRPTLKDRAKSLQLIKKYSLDYEDALTLQCAISTDCKNILSFDKHFNKVKEIKRIEP